MRSRDSQSAAPLSTPARSSPDNYTQTPALSPEGQVLEVPPAPGRVVLLDQDITHAVSRPRAAARARARYSLVLKLVLHPREGGAAPPSRGWSTSLSTRL